MGIMHNGKPLWNRIWCHAQQFRLKLIFLLLIFQVSQSFFWRTSLVDIIQLTPGHARKATVTLALPLLTMTTSVTKTATEIRAANKCAQPKNLIKLFEQLNEASTVLWPHCVLLVTLVKNLWIGGLLSTETLLCKRDYIL